MKSKALTCINAMGLLGLAFLLLAALAVAPATAGETVLYSFSPYLNGTNPLANVCLGPGGKLYGTTYGGGSGNAGVVFRVDNAGHEAVLHNFTGGADGANPYFDVMCNSAGNIYGTTLNGGPAGAGVVFRVSGAGHESVLYSFTGGADGGYPYTNLIQDSAGNLYGTTAGGGSGGAGVVFKLDKKGLETVLYSFTGGADGGFPYGGLIQDSAGNLYGTTGGGGSGGAGVLFKLDTMGHQTVLYSFTGGTDGGYPNTVIQDSAGNLYGTAYLGGAAGAGVVFKVDPMGNETVLHSFTGGADGGYPNSSALVQDSAGNLYGATSSGGSAGAGVVFKVDAAGNETVLYSFTGGKDGAYPQASVVRDSAGNLYGTTSGGGEAGAGALFKLDPAGHETVLYGFPETDGSNPLAGVIQDSAGNLYGTTTGGGVDGAGVVYKVNPTGNETILYTFTGGADGATPYAGLIQDSTGNFFGTTEFGGAAGKGTVYKLDGSGHETVLYSFTAGTDGAYPLAALIQDSAGNFYGTTLNGGSGGKGVVFKLDPAGHESVLHNFTGPDGSYPYSGVTFDSAGNLYGTATQGGTRGGVVYKLDPAGNYTVLHDFTYGPDGGFPWGGVILDSAGNLYATTWSGGPPSGDYPGVVYKVDSSGNFSVVYTFTGFSDGGGSRSNLVFDSAGNLYGTTQYGGRGSCPYFGCGVVFELNPAGQQTVLYSFSGGADGSEPGTGLIRDSSGNLYGTTSYGGSGAGVVYEVTPGGGSPGVAQPIQRSFSPLGLGPNHPLPGEPPQYREKPRS